MRKEWPSKFCIEAVNCLEISRVARLSSNRRVVLRIATRRGVLFFSSSSSSPLAVVAVERRLPSLVHKIVDVVSDPINVTSPFPEW